MSVKADKADPYKAAIAQNLRAKTQRLEQRAKINGKS